MYLYKSESYESKDDMFLMQLLNGKPNLDENVRFIAIS